MVSPEINPSWRRYLGWIAAGGLISAGVRGIHDNHKLGSLLVDPYWVGFYVTNFQDGFRRRALLGTLSRLAQPHGMSVIVINVLAIAALLGVLALFVRSFVRLASPAMPRTALFTFALFASALGSIYFEVLGDTLQIAFLVFAFFAILPALRVSRYPVRLGLALTGLVLAFFIHEASVFLLAPCVPFVTRERVRPRDFFAPVIALAVLVALSMHWSHLQTHLTYHAISIPRGKPLEDLAATPGFMELLRLEWLDDFSTRSHFVFFLIKCASILGLGLAGMIAVANSFAVANLRRAVVIFLAILLISSPLWIIAHDWGRFLAYSFFLTALSASFFPEGDFEFGARFFSGLTGQIKRVANLDAFQGAAMLLLLASPAYQSRIFGMRIRDFLSSLAIVAVGAFVLARKPLVFRDPDTGRDAE